jgi:hypothetical protein
MLADVPARVEEKDGVPVIVTDRAMEQMTVAQTREAIESTRRRNALPPVDAARLRADIDALLDSSL